MNNKIKIKKKNKNKTTKKKNKNKLNQLQKISTCPNCFIS
jgi:hypothetical protein